MIKKVELPAPEVIEKTVKNWRNVCYRLDSLTLQLDELIAMIEADIRYSPLTQYRLKRAKRLTGLNTQALEN